MSGSGQRMFRGFGTVWEEEQAELAAREYAARNAGEGQNVPSTSGDIRTAQSQPDRNTNASLVTNYQTSTVGNQAGFDWAGMTQGLVGGLLNVFRGNNNQYPPGYYPPGYPPPAEPLPVWVWLAIPVGLIAVVAMTRKKSSVAGYRRRKSRR